MHSVTTKNCFRQSLPPATVCAIPTIFAHIKKLTFSLQADKSESVKALCVNYCQSHYLDFS